MKVKPSSILTQRAHFNLIEVILAMGIILVGVVSVLALFPASQRTTSSAIGRNSAGDSADQFLRYFSSKVKARWALVNALPMSKPGPDAEIDAVWESVDGNNIFSGVKGVVFMYNDVANASGTRFDYDGDQRDDSGLFRVVQRTSENADDFSGVLRVWKNSATYSSYDTAGSSWNANKPVPPDQGVVLNVEVSWPAELPYVRREKATYSTNVFRPSEHEMEEVAGAFEIKQSGKLKITYHGSDAGWKSEFWVMHRQDDNDDWTEEQIFKSNQKTDQVTVVDKEFPPGTKFNFFTKTHGKGKWGTYDHYAWAPPEPDDECACRVIGGKLNLNPSNSPNNEFVMKTTDGTVITRDDLHRTTAVDSQGTFWQGTATYLKVRPKGNGNQNTLTVNDVAYQMANSTVYEITGEEIQVRVYNDHIKNSKAMGHWWIDTESGCAQILEAGQSHDRWCIYHPDNIQDMIVDDIPFYDKAGGPYNATFHFDTGNPYALTTDLEPGRKWLLRFEDLPGYLNWIDWDYNDVVITAELLDNSGVQQSVAGVPIASKGNTWIELNQGNNWRMSLTKADGTFMTDSDIKPYDGKAIALWIRPNPSGGGAGSTVNFEVDGADHAIAPNQMISVAGTDVDVKIIKSGSTWKARVSTPSGFFTVMQ